MRISSAFPISLSLALGLLGSAAAAPARQVEISYELSRNGTPVAESVERLAHDGKTYTLESVTKGKGLLALRGDATRTSRGAIGPGGLKPAEFEDRRSGREPAGATFDWATHTLTLRSGEGPAQTRALPDGLLDRLAFQYGFAFRPPGGKPLTFEVTDGKGIATSVYRPSGHEVLKVPAGEFDTLKLVREKTGPEDRTTEIWLAEKHAYLPVRVLVVDKRGTRLDQVATRLSEQ